MTAIRRPGAASATVLVVLSASLVVAHLIAPDWSRRAGLDVWNLAALEAQYETIAEENADMQAQAEQAAARRAAANQIAAKLISKTITLPAATDELLEVFREDKGMLVVLEIIHQGTATQKHVFARHGIDRVKAILVNNPTQRDAVVARLEVEYRAMCAAPESPRTP